MIILQNGTLITPEGPERAMLAMDGGRIARIAPQLDAAPGDELVDASGCLVFPGFIDGHTHLDMGEGPTRTADDFESGTRAAACGGTTTIVDFATQAKGGTLADALAEWQRKAAGRCAANYAFHMAITDWNARVKAELPALREAGVSSFKVYLAYDALRVDDAELLDILESLKPLGGILGVHCENGTLVDALQARELSLGHRGPTGHPASRPPEAEAEAIDRLCWIARLADAPVHVVHLSSALGLEEVRRARRRGQTVYAETCPQYLLLDESRYFLPGFEGAKYVMSPPLRSPADAAALRAAVIAGEIGSIATDHCSFRFVGQKELGREDFTRIPNGAPGIEHRPALMFTAFTREELSWGALCRLLSEGPARLFGLYPRKGVLREGADADVTVWDSAARWTIRAAEQQQNVDYTPYEGMTVTGRARYVYVNGVLAARDGRPTGQRPGCYVKR